jgi:hypothetical protein
MTIEQLEAYCEAQGHTSDHAQRAKIYQHLATFMHQEHPSKERMLTELAERATRAQQTIELLEHGSAMETLIVPYQVQEDVCEELFELLLTSPR